MRKWLIVCVLAFAGLTASANRASAYWHYGLWVTPYYTPVAYPMITPSGYFSNSYYFPWYYPWYANYNYANGYYANWWLGGGYASYVGQQMPPIVAPNANINITVIDKEKTVIPIKVVPKKATTLPAPGKVSISLPADAKLQFNGVPAEGRGETRIFVTPELLPNRDYEYVLTAEVVRDGQAETIVERAIVRAGETTQVTLSPTAAARK